MSDQTPSKRPLTAFEKLKPKQKAFVLAVVKPGASLSAAAIEAGYTQDVKNSYPIGSRLARNDNIRAAIGEIFAKQGASAGEVANTLTVVLRSTFDDFLEIDDATKRATIDLDKAKKIGVLGAMKKLTVKEYYDKGKSAHVTETTIELHDKLAAANMLARHLRMYEGEPSHVDTTKTGVLEVPAKPAATPTAEEQWSNNANALEPKA